MWILYLIILKTYIRLKAFEHRIESNSMVGGNGNGNRNRSGNGNENENGRRVEKMHTTKQVYYRWKRDIHRCSGWYLYARKSLNGIEGPQQTVTECPLYMVGCCSCICFHVYLLTLIVYKTEKYARIMLSVN